MAANRGVRNFYELRQGFDLVEEFIIGARQMLDEQGIALQARKTYKKKVNGDGGAPVVKNTGKLRDTVKRLYTQRRSVAKPAGKRHGVEPDGDHLTIGEAAKILKMSDANVRLMMKDGRINQPTRYENRLTKAGTTLPVLVIHKDAVAKAADEHPISKARQVSAKRARAKRKKG